MVAPPESPGGGIALRTVLALSTLLVLAPLALAQEHAHGGGQGGATVLYDGPPSGRAVVGGSTHFGFALIGEDGAPVVHQDAAFTLTQNGRTLFATTDTHEYDGLFSFDVLFTEPGPYEVTATSGDMPLGVFRGEAVRPANVSEARVELTQRGTSFEISIVDASGAIIDHTDAIIEFRTVAGDALHARTHLHIHDAPIAFEQAVLPGTEYVAHVVAYRAFPTGRSADVRAIVGEFPIASQAPAVPGAPPLPTPAAPMPLEQRGATASADGMTLHAMYDPNQQVGVGQIARIAGAVTLDENSTTLQHVDFRFALHGPAGLVFATESGHEYDGVFEYLFRPPFPGVYRGTMVASYDDVELEVPVEVLAVPPVVPLLGGTGLVTASVAGLDGVAAGEETELVFLATGSAGPAAHSEVDVTIFHEGEAPLYQFKLHTHDSGETKALVRFPHPGEWQIRIDPLPTLPEASVYVSTLEVFEVAEGAEGILPLAAAGGAPAANVPGAWGALGLAAIAGAAFVSRRR